MKREELFMVETYKCEELRKKLKPITDWHKVKQGTRIFHDDDNSINNQNIFVEYNKKDNIIRYTVIDYSKSENKDYTMSATGWYYYDEDIADMAEEHFTPKLYVISSIKYQEDYWYLAAFDEEDAHIEFEKSMRMEHMDKDKFWEKYECEQIENVDGFDVVLK